MVKSHSDRPKQSGTDVRQRPLLIYCGFEVSFNEKCIEKNDRVMLNLCLTVHYIPIPEKTTYKNSLKLLLASSIYLQLERAGNVVRAWYELLGLCEDEART